MVWRQAAAGEPAGGVGTGFGARHPVSHFNLNYRSIVGTDAATVAPTSLRGDPTAPAHHALPQILGVCLHAQSLTKPSSLTHSAEWGEFHTRR
jgi:hypothetical protein